jgi:hypothetical protein
MRAPRLVLIAFLALSVSACSQDVVDKAASAISEPQAQDVEPQAKSKAEAATGTKAGGKPLPADFPVDEVPVLDVRVLAATQPQNDSWNLLMESTGQTTDLMEAAAVLLSDAGFAAEGIQAESMQQWVTDDYAVTVLIAPMAGDESRASINYAVTRL